MRHRSNSGVRLDYFQRMVQKTILKYQNPVTGLLPATPTHSHAWVRDNVYSVLAVWGLALAYKKTADLDEDRAKAYELEQSVVKLMRGLLRSMMTQIGKVEKFKTTQSTRDSLHAKYSVTRGQTVVGDHEWGHLQLDATSLFLLTLGQMTASGLQIVYSYDEVAFIQNLLFYIQAAYRCPDYGIWERGDKTNHGLPELNATSIGMAKAALEALNELDLYGARGGPSSVVHVVPDEAQQCQAILHSVLPRESNSKETDAGLLSVISYPAFSVDDQEIIDLTKEKVISKLQGRFGCCRFLRDGYKTPKEDPHRNHYEPWELAIFENIECEWPLFYAYMVLDGLFTNNPQQVESYSEELDKLMVKRDDGIKIMPELYAVPLDKVDAEYKNPGSQERVPQGKMPHMWGQSLYVLGRLIKEGFLSPGELDPLNRRLTAEPKPDTVVQVVILAEDESIQEKLAYYDIKAQTIHEVDEIDSIQVYPAKLLSKLLSHLGRSEKLGLSGRPSDVVGILSTAKVYTLMDKTLAFFPQFIDQQHFYLPLDVCLVLDMVKSDIRYLGHYWKNLGRPVLFWPIKSTMLDIGRSLHPALIATLKKLQSGYINGTRVHLGHLKDFLSTSCVTNLTFLAETDSADHELIGYINKFSLAKTRRTQYLGRPEGGRRNSRGAKVKRKSSVKGIIKRSYSIQVEQGDFPEHMMTHRASITGHQMSLPVNKSSPELSYLSPWTTSAASLHVPGLLSPTTAPNAPDFSKGFSSGSMSPTSGSMSPTSPSATAPAPSFTVPTITHTPSHPHLKGDDGGPAPDLVQSYHDRRYEGVDVQDLIEQLKETELLHEQADIIHFLYMSKGPDWDTQIEDKAGCKVRDLLVELYEKAGQLKQWWLVRHTAGILKKQVEDLAKAATDILVRQKQLAVGMPPEPREKIITRPLPPDELATIINSACGDDSSTAMLTQEILVYLAMYIRTEPKLFKEMLRLRVGLIIQVMASELGRTLKCSGEEASDQLLNLSPYEMKTLLHHILSGKEFGVSSDDDTFLSVGEVITHVERRRMVSGVHIGHKIFHAPELRILTTVDDLGALPLDPSSANQLQDSMETDRHGQWLRRRRLDGSLNRVPVHFYEDIWNVLKRCHGLSMEGNLLPQSLTKEMTRGEFKFALQVEMLLNRIPQPEYRQLMVEAMMVLCLVVEHDNGKTSWNEVIHVERLVKMANEIFIEEQKVVDGDVTLCCSINPRPVPLKCGGIAGICQNFFDTAPSGRYGTMSYLCKAALKMLPFPTCDNGNLDCVVS